MRTPRQGLRKNRTRKSYSLPIQGSIVSETEGWKTVHIYGEPYERGYAHGYLLAAELRRVKKLLPFLVKYQLQETSRDFHRANRKIMFPLLKRVYPEYWHEIRGICAGSRRAGVDISMDTLIGWNAYVSLYSYFKEGSKHIHRCSAFIATGSATRDGKIVMGHNVHSDLATGQLLNIVMKITPSQGHPFIMQTSPGLISSVADWYISSTGIVCCETTIADINYRPRFGLPFFTRIRHAVQYGKTLDDCAKIMLHKNAGDYACSWLFGDTNTQEIMLLEMGLNVHNLQRTFNGAFYGMNSAISTELRTKETDDVDYHNVASRSGNRNYRLDELVNRQYYGKIDIKVAKKIMADHYDIVLGKNTLNQNGICKHPELDPDADYKPYSCTDGKVVDADLAKELHFEGIFGSACGSRPFHVKQYVKDHPQYAHWKDVLEDMSLHHWTLL